MSTFTFDTTQTGLRKTLREWEEIALRYLWSIGEVRARDAGGLTGGAGWLIDMSNQLWIRRLMFDIYYEEVRVIVWQLPS